MPDGLTLFAWLVLGVVIGCPGSLVMRTDPDQGVLSHALIGSPGALALSVKVRMDGQRPAA